MEVHGGDEVLDEVLAQVGVRMDLPAGDVGIEGDRQRVEGDVRDRLGELLRAEAISLEWKALDTASFLAL